MLGSLAPAAFAATTSSSYTDLSGYSWASQDINSLSAQGYIHGYSNGTFQPGAYVSRGQFLAYFMNAMAAVTGVKPHNAGKVFKDVEPGNWAYEYVGAAYKAGWINPYWLNVKIGGNFNENYQASYGDAASFFVAAMEKAGVITSTNGMAPLEYAKSIGLFKGIPSTQSAVYMNRAAAAVVLQNMLNYLNPPMPTPASESLALNASTLVANGTATDTVTATVVDANGNPVPGVTVSFASTNTGVATVTSSATTDSNGMATATITAGKTVGTTAITATVDGITQVKLLTTTPASTAPNLTNLTLTGQTVGTGTQTAPAVAIDGNTISLSTTLTDASGNPLSGVQVTFDLTGATTDVLANGSSITGSTVTATTNSSGVATLTLQYEGVGTAALSVQASAPFTSSGVMSNTAYVQWGQAGGVVLSQSTTSAEYSTYNNPSQGVVTYTATVLPESGLSSLSGIPVTFNLTTSGSNAPYFTNSQGSVNLSTTTFVANTNAEGQAVAYVNSVLPQASYSTAATTASVDASATVNNVTTTTSTETTTWNVPGVPAMLSTAGWTESNTAPSAGTQVTLSGTVVDALGNPVPNANLEVVGTPGTAGTDSYVSNGTTTAFPTNPPSNSSELAGSTYGEEITTNASGNFSFVVTDSAAETDTYTLYDVMPSGYFNTSSNLGSTTVTFGPATTVTAMGVGAGQNSLLGSYTSSTSPSTVPSTLTGMMVPAGTLSTNPSATTAQVEAAPYLEIGGYNTVGSQVALSPTNPSVSYVISGNNSGQIAAVDGVELSAPVSSATITFTYTGSSNKPSITVNGNSITPATYPTLFSNNDPLVYVTIQDAKSESDLFTITSGSAKATATVDFSTAAVNSVSLTPSFVQTVLGQPVTVTLTAEDVNGNPVPNSSLYLNSTNLTGLFITAVNGQALTQYINGVSEPTPIPLFSNATTGYPSVYASDISATGIGLSSAPSVTLTTGSNGQVTITLQNGNVGYWNGTTATVYQTYSTNPLPLNVYSNPTATTSVGSGTFQW